MLLNLFDKKSKLKAYGMILIDIVVFYVPMVLSHFKAVSHRRMIRMLQ